MENFMKHFFDLAGLLGSPSVSEQEALKKWMALSFLNLSSVLEYSFLKLNLISGFPYFQYNAKAFNLEFCRLSLDHI